MPIQTPPTVLRVILNAGHGLSNKTPGVFDTGATSEFGSEYSIVSAISDKVCDHYFFAADDTQTPSETVTVIDTPSCSPQCVTRWHASSSHLSYVVRWINENARKFDYVVSLHMNSAEDCNVSGTEVYYSKTAPHRRIDEARAVAQEVANVLGIPNRGVYRSSESQHSTLAILDDTDPPALLIELGYVTNKQDVEAVTECGAKAVLAAIEAIRRTHH